MPTLYMLKGLPASGKTTLARKMVEDGCKRVNRDDLRSMIDNGHYSVARELLIKEIRDAIITRCLWLGHDVVVDDTNLKPSDEEDFRTLIVAGNINFEIIEMDTPLEVCLERDKNRENSIRVGEKVIRDMYDKYLKVPE